MIREIERKFLKVARVYLSGAKKRNVSSFPKSFGAKRGLLSENIVQEHVLSKLCKMQHDYSLLNEAQQLRGFFDRV